MSEYAYSGVFRVTDYESEVKSEKIVNPRWRIQYGECTFWLKCLFLNIFESICDLYGFRGLWLRIWNQISKIQKSKVAVPTWWTYFLAKIFVFEYFGFNMRPFSGSLITNLREFIIVKIQCGYSMMDLFSCIYYFIVILLHLLHCPTLASLEVNDTKGIFYFFFIFIFIFFCFFWHPYDCAPKNRSRKWLFTQR